MNYPRFIVYTTPQTLEQQLMGRMMILDNDQARLLLDLHRAGYCPVINSLRQPSVQDIQPLIGFVYLCDNTFVECSQYTGGEIACLQWYIEPVKDMDQIIKRMMPLYYGNCLGPSTEPEIIPPAMTQCTNQSEFIGNNVIL